MQRALLKDIKECRKKLCPTADTHRDHDLDLLKTHVGHAVDLLSNPCLPFEVTDDLRANVGLVHKDMMAVAASGSKLKDSDATPITSTVAHWQGDIGFIEYLTLLSSSF